MPELDTISIRGFKSIAAIDDLKLGAINVLIGSNGAGKSNFVEAFAFLHALREGQLQAYVGKAGGAARILHFGPKVTDKVWLGIGFQNGGNLYEIELRRTDADDLMPAYEAAGFWNKAKGYFQPYWDTLSRSGNEAGISTQTASPVATYVRRHLDSWRIYHFQDTSSNAPMKLAANLNDNRYLRPDGSNLPAFLYLLRETCPSSYVLIRNAVQLVAPFFDDFGLEPQQLNSDMIRLEWRHRNTEEYFDVSSLSDGTLRFIALATLFLQPANHRPSVILVDEPELGLHPYAVTLLASLVRQASTVTQVILATQSPVLLDHFAPDEVLIADLIDGSTRITRLELGQARGLAEEVQPRPIMGEERVGRAPRRGMTAWSGC